MCRVGLGLGTFPRFEVGGTLVSELQLISITRAVGRQTMVLHICVAASARFVERSGQLSDVSSREQRSLSRIPVLVPKFDSFDVR